jgi:hypothetical protein
MREYTIPFGPTAETATFDIFEVAPADDKPITLLGIILSQTTEIADAQEEMLEVIITRGGTAMTSGSGGNTGVTAQPADPADAACGAAIETLNTTKATFTSGVVMYRDAFNVRTGWQYLPTPEQWIRVTQIQGGLSASIPGTPTDSITFCGTVIIGEG